jgi:hypothetical protein
VREKSFDDRSREAGMSSSAHSESRWLFTFVLPIIILDLSYASCRTHFKFKKRPLYFLLHMMRGGWSKTIKTSKESRLINWILCGNDIVYIELYRIASKQEEQD